MQLNPRRNFAATSAGVLGVAIFLAIEVFEPTNLFNPVRLALLAAGVACLAAGAWPSRRVRFAVLLVAVPVMLLVGVLALWTVGFLILPIALLAGFGLFIEYAREGRE